MWPYSWPLTQFGTANSRDNWKKRTDTQTHFPLVTYFNWLWDPQASEVLISRKKKWRSQDKLQLQVVLKPRLKRDLEIHFSFIFSLCLSCVRSMACTIGACIILWPILSPSCLSNCQYLSDMSQPQLADVWLTSTRKVWGRETPSGLN